MAESSSPPNPINNVCPCPCHYILAQEIIKIRVRKPDVPPNKTKKLCIVSMNSCCSFINLKNTMKTGGGTGDPPPPPPSNP